MSWPSDDEMALPEPGKYALELLAAASQEAPPVQLDPVIGLWRGLSVASEQLDGEGYLLKFGEREAEILVKASDQEARRRWTVAHELGHWVLDQEGVWSAGAKPSESQHAQIELWCDEFAANLLLPESWVRADLRAAKIGSLMDGVINLAERYGVSRLASLIRISRVTPLTLFIAEYVESAGQAGLRWTCQRSFVAGSGSKTWGAVSRALDRFASPDAVPYLIEIGGGARVVAYRESRSRLLLAVIPPRTPGRQA